MRVSEYVETGSELADLARLAETGLGQLIERVVAKREAEAVADLRRGIKTDTDRITGYKAGFADGIGWLLQLRPAAWEELRDQKRKGAEA